MTYKDRKRVRELLKGARKLHHANSDILSAKDNELLVKAMDSVDRACRAKDNGEISKSVTQLEKQLDRIFPPKKNNWLRENVEVLLVAVVVAMAVRTYFLQPFKIPTGSMQPTLYGIHTPSLEYPPGENIQAPPAFPLNPVNVVQWLLWGKTVAANGLVEITGDHIFVDKVTYNFRNPRRGDVIVFATSGIPDLEKDRFYIKRCVGLPGETIAIRPPYLFINGTKIEGGPFDRMYSMQDGYHGYTLPRGASYFDDGLRRDIEFRVSTEHPSYQIPARSFFACGDNSRNSKDGRYWGPVPQQNMVGKALWTYWPFSKRWGLVN